MATIFIIHGSYGYPGENWFPWLKDELEKLGHQVIVPQFPTPEGQEIENWLAEFEKYLPKLVPKTILIGHSCGAAFILRQLERVDTRVKACFLVAGPVHPLGNEFDKVHMSFVDHDFEWDIIKDSAGSFYPIYSDNDPYVKINHGRIAAMNLGAKLWVIKKAGHFNAKAGYTKFEFLLQLVKAELEP